MNTEYKQRLEKIEAVLDSWLPEKPDTLWLEKVFGSNIVARVDPKLAATLSMPGWDLVKRGGKRWRPLLMLLVAESINGEKGAEAALPLMPLVEFPHNASLIHDDIEDNSDERRGKPAIHLLYGTDLAINSGSFMYFLPLACLKAYRGDLALKERLWTIWSDHMRALHLGQAMDISWHQDFHSLPGLEEYDLMCRLKTGCLARLAAVLGINCAGAGDNKELTERFGTAAEQLGVGFQILDDVKNLDEGIPGKKRGDDIVEGKKSLPVLLYLHRFPEQKDFVARCFTAARSGGAGVPEVEEMIGTLEKANIIKEARERGLEYINKSREIFSSEEMSGFPLLEDGKRRLAGLVDLLR